MSDEDFKNGIIAQMSQMTGLFKEMSLEVKDLSTKVHSFELEQVKLKTKMAMVGFGLAVVNVVTGFDLSRFFGN